VLTIRVRREKERRTQDERGKKEGTSDPHPVRASPGKKEEKTERREKKKKKREVRQKLSTPSPA